MAVAAMTLRPRERRLALIASILIGVWAVVAWCIQPLWERVRDVGVNVGMRTEKLSAMTRLLEQTPQIARDYQTYRAYLEPGEGEAVGRALFQEVNLIARFFEESLERDDRRALPSLRCSGEFNDERPTSLSPQNRQQIACQLEQGLPLRDLISLWRNSGLHSLHLARTPVQAATITDRRLEEASPNRLPKSCAGRR